MKLKVGLKFKSIEGPSKGKEFMVVFLDKYEVQYKSIETGQFYEESRKNFEKRMERINKHWSDTNKSYKHKKQEMRGD